MASIASHDCTIIILAAQRTGVVNPLALRAGVSHKCIVPICGKPLIVHVMDVIAALPVRPKVRISVEKDAHPQLGEILEPYREKGLDIDFLPSSPNIAESVILAAEDQPAPYIVTTADNVLLSGEVIEHALKELKRADVLATLTRDESVRAVHPEGQRRFYKFKDGGYANCNVYGIAGPHALRATEAFREGGQFMNNPKRLVKAFGIVNIALFRAGLLSLEGAMKRLSKRFGVTVRAIVPSDGAQAIDVDNERTYDIAEIVMKERKGSS